MPLVRVNDLEDKYFTNSSLAKFRMMASVKDFFTITAFFSTRVRNRHFVIGKENALNLSEAFAPEKMSLLTKPCLC